MENFGTATAIRTERQRIFSLTYQNDRDHLPAKFGHLKVRAVSLDSVLKPTSGTNNSIHTDLFDVNPAQPKALLSTTDTHSYPDEFKEFQATSVNRALIKLNLKQTGIELGKGTYGIVKEWLTEDGKSMAVKKISATKYLTTDAGLNTGEVCALDLGPHPNLVKVQTILVKKKNTDTYAEIKSTKSLTDSIKRDYHLAAIISDKASGTELWDILHSQPTPRTNQLAAHIGHCVSDAIDYLHEEGMIYRDIKPENIIFNPNTKEVKIVDFGFLKDIKQFKRTNSFIGTLEFMAPEVCQLLDANKQRPTYGFQYDTWELGCLLCEFITDKTPTNILIINNLNTQTDELIKKVKNTERFSKLTDNVKKPLIRNHRARNFKEEVDPDLLDITVKSLRYDEEKRITIGEAKEQLSKLLLKLGKK